MFTSDVSECYKHVSECYKHLIWSIVWDIIGCYKQLIANLKQLIEFILLDTIGCYKHVSECYKHLIWCCYLLFSGNLAFIRRLLVGWFGALLWFGWALL